MSSSLRRPRNFMILSTNRIQTMKLHPLNLKRHQSILSQLMKVKKVIITIRKEIGRIGKICYKKKNKKF